MQKIGGYVAVTQGLSTCWNMTFQNIINSYSSPGNCKYSLFSIRFHFNFNDNIQCIIFMYFVYVPTNFTKVYKLTYYKSLSYSHQNM